MKTIPARYFDGRTARAHDVQLFAAAGMLSMVGHTAAARFKPGQFRIGEPFATATLVLEFADGTHCEVAASRREDLLGVLGYRPSLVERWQAWWKGALAALAVLLGTALAGYVYGLPAMAEWLVAQTPPSADLRIGDTALREIGKLMEPSALGDERLREIDAVFARVRPAAKRMPVRLLVRHVPSIGANAFALPNGTIVMTDDLVNMMIGKGSVTESQDAIAAVLLHEIAHVEHRHTMRSLSRASLVTGASWFLFGDFSAVASGVPAMLENMSYSREMETEADDFAIARLKLLGVRPAMMSVSLLRLNGGPVLAEDELPGWMRATSGYLSTHPGTGERLDHINAADPAGKADAEAFVEREAPPPGYARRTRPRDKPGYEPVEDPSLFDQLPPGY